MAVFAQRRDLQRKSFCKSGRSASNGRCLGALRVHIRARASVHAYVRAWARMQLDFVFKKEISYFEDPEHLPPLSTDDIWKYIDEVAIPNQFDALHLDTIAVGPLNIMQAHAQLVQSALNQGHCAHSVHTCRDACIHGANVHEPGDARCRGCTHACTPARTH